MKAKKRWRYYCDYCGKVGGSRGHMAKHEESCTMNPARKCRMCHYCDQVQEDIEDIMDAIMEDANCFFERKVEDEKQKRWGFHPLDKIPLYRATKLTTCPACILAGMRLISPGYGMESVRDFYGHSSTRMTRHYAKVLDEQMVDMYERGGDVGKKKKRNGL